MTLHEVGATVTVHRCNHGYGDFEGLVEEVIPNDHNDDATYIVRDLNENDTVEVNRTADMS